MSPQPKQHVFDPVSERLTIMETIVGKTPEEGLRKEVSNMRQVLRAMEMRYYVALGGAIVLWNVLDKVVFHK
jgi:hypothetical protein